MKAALQLMRVSSSLTKQQDYHALHELTSASYFSTPSTWRLTDNTGPTDI
jgi:hypothetical protein